MKKCSNCYYFDSCGCESACEDYYPVEDDAENEAIDELIEKNRYEFHDDWNKYISENEF